MPIDLILSAGRVLLPRGVWLTPGALLLRAGRIEAVGSPRALKTSRPTLACVELPGLALLPGLVNAHAHLELTGLAGSTPAGADFGKWVRAVVAGRSAMPTAQLEASARSGARQCLAGATTTVGDFDATGAAERAFSADARQLFPRVVLFRELLDARRIERTSLELARAQAAWSPGERLSPGLAPHAPHTVSAGLLAEIARVARGGAFALSTHWAETAEEGEWLESGTGPFAGLLVDSPRRSGLDLLADAGLLGPQLALVHGNAARPEEISRVAHSGSTLVHCPGSHAFFGRAPFDLRAWLTAGVAVALGTDSLASNSALDMRLELARLMAEHPWLDPRDAWDAATLNGARALGLRGHVGELTPGAFADVLAVPADDPDGQTCLRRLVHGDFEVAHTWIGGCVPAIADSAIAPMGCVRGSDGPG